MVGDEGTGGGVRGISGGERKRVTVGVGLVTQPHVLLLDEPTSGLDSETAVAIVELMRDLARQVSSLLTTCLYQHLMTNHLRQSAPFRTTCATCITVKSVMSGCCGTWEFCFIQMQL